MHFFANLFRRKREMTMSRPKDEPVSLIAKRLAAEVALLQELEFERHSRADPSYGSATEDRIIWRELYDLELQEVDEQISSHSSE